jgi:hypothetical protein
MNPSSPNHHQPTTRFVTGAGHYQPCFDTQTGWGVETFVHDTRSYRSVKIEADNQSRAITIRADVRANLSQSGNKSVDPCAGSGRPMR